MSANVNTETNVPYGVVSLASLQDWIWEEFFHNGKSLTYDAAWAEYMAENAITEESDDYDEHWHEFSDGYQCDEEEYYLETDGMKLLLGYLGGAALVWVMESPHKAHCRMCSPCVPNAGDLDNKDEYGMECYDVPAEWYRSDDE